MVMQPSNPGWSSTPMAGSASNVDTFSRIMAMRYGDRSDDIWSYLDQPGYRTTIGSATTAPNAGYASNMGSGTFRLSQMGGGGTPSDPGGYNWNTLGSAVQVAKNEVYNPIADFVAPNVDKKGRFKPRGPSGSIYGRYRGKQQQIQYNQQEEAKQQALQQQNAQAQQQQATLTMQQQYANMYNPNMNYAYAYQQAAQQTTPPKRKTRTTASKPKATRPTVKTATPKARTTAKTVPSITELNAPSNW